MSAGTAFDDDIPFFGTCLIFITVLVNDQPAVLVRIQPSFIQQCEFVLVSLRYLDGIGTLSAGCGILHCRQRCSAVADGIHFYIVQRGTDMGLQIQVRLLTRNVRAAGQTGNAGIIPLIYAVLLPGNRTALYIESPV